MLPVECCPTSTSVLWKVIFAKVPKMLTAYFFNLPNKPFNLLTFIGVGAFKIASSLLVWGLNHIY